MLNPYLIRTMSAWSLGVVSLLLGYVGGPFGRYVDQPLASIPLLHFLAPAAPSVAALFATALVLPVIDIYRRNDTLPRWSFAPAGGAVLLIGAYNFFSIVDFTSGLDPLTAIWRAGISVTLLGIVAIGLGAMLLVVRPLPGTAPVKSDPDGTWKAKWWDMREAAKVLSVAGGLILGEACIPSREKFMWGYAALLTALPDGHILSIAGSGAGKGVGIVVPNCLGRAGPIVVHDPAGETLAIVKEHRQRIGRTVRVVSINADTDGVNILSWLNPGARTFVGDVRTVVSWFDRGDDGGSDEDSSFGGLARTLCASLIMHVMTFSAIPPEQRTLKKVRELGCSQRLRDILMTMTSAEASQIANGAMTNGANIVLRTMESAETYAGVNMHFDKLTQFIEGNEAILCGEGIAPGKRFKLSDILEGTTDFFICIPTDILDSTPQIARVLLGSLATMFLRQNKKAKFDTLFIVDEMPRLGHLKVLESARDTARKYALYLWAICQDIGQLKKAYGEEGFISWMASMAVKQFFGVNDLETAKYLSEYCGTYTALVESKGISITNNMGSSAGSGGSSKNKSTNTQPVEVLLIAPSELISRMAKGKDRKTIEQLLLVRGEDPLRCGLVKYYVRPELLALASANPFFSATAAKRQLRRFGGPALAALGLLGVLVAGLLAPIPLRSNDMARVTEATRAYVQYSGNYRRIDDIPSGTRLRIISEPRKDGFVEISVMADMQEIRALVPTSLLRYQRPL